MDSYYDNYKTLNRELVLKIQQQKETISLLSNEIVKLRQDKIEVAQKYREDNELFKKELMTYMCMIQDCLGKVFNIIYSRHSNGIIRNGSVDMETSRRSSNHNLNSLRISPTSFNRHTNRNSIVNNNLSLNLPIENEGESPIACYVNKRRRGNSEVLSLPLSPTIQSTSTSFVPHQSNEIIESSFPSTSTQFRTDTENVVDDVLASIQNNRSQSLFSMTPIREEETLLNSLSRTLINTSLTNHECITNKDKSMPIITEVSSIRPYDGIASTSAQAMSMDMGAINNLTISKAPCSTPRSLLKNEKKYRDIEKSMKNVKVKLTRLKIQAFIKKEPLTSNKNINSQNTRNNEEMISQTTIKNEYDEENETKFNRKVNRKKKIIHMPTTDEVKVRVRRNVTRCLAEPDLRLKLRQ